MKGYLFFDIDGTLVDSPRSNEIEDDVRDLLKKARENGYGCFIASGRNRKGIEKYMGDGFDGYVYADGAGIELTGHEPVFFPIEEELVRKLEDIVMRQYHGNFCPWSKDWGYASDDTFDLFCGYAGISPAADDVEKQMAEKAGLKRLAERDPGEPILSCDVEFPSCIEEKDFMEHLDERLEYISTSASYGRGGICTGEVTAKGVTKGSGARQLVAMLGGDMKDTYAFGDSMNDAMILKEVRHGICMGNGAEELKAIADYVTDDINYGGIEKAMKHYKIIEKY